MIESFFFGVVAFGCTYWLLMYWLNWFTEEEFNHDLEVGAAQPINPDLPYPLIFHVVFTFISLLVGGVAFYVWAIMWAIL